MYAYVNGQVVKEEEAQVSIFDHGFMYGIGVFETFRVYEGHPFLFHDHLKRLRKSLKSLDIIYEKKDEEILVAVQKLLTANELTNAYVRLNISAGDSMLGLQTEPYQSPTEIIYMKPMPALVSGTSKKLTSLKTRRNTPEGDYRLKSHHFMNNYLGKKEAGASSEVEGLFLSQDSYVAEGVVSNVFWVKEQTVYTPSVNTGILDGITRNFIIALLKKHNLNIQVGKFTYAELIDCDEAFVTNSIQEVVPISAIDGTQLDPYKNNVTKKLRDLYRQYRTSLWSITDL
jgi:4-amino-4-deoxychorismate lyase